MERRSRHPLGGAAADGVILTIFRGGEFLGNNNVDKRIFRLCMEYFSRCDRAGLNRRPRCTLPLEVPF